MKTRLSIALLAIASISCGPAAMTAAVVVTESETRKIIADYEGGQQPGDAVSWAHLGLAYTYRHQAHGTDGAAEQAIHAYDAALHLDPDLGVALWNLAELLHHLGRDSEAAPHYERFFELNPNHPRRDEVETRLHR